MAGAGRGRVVLYSSNNVETVNQVVDQFTKENPDIKVSVVRAAPGALMQHIKAEAANPLGDIFWSGGLSTIGEFRDQFQPPRIRAGRRRTPARPRTQRPLAEHRVHG